MQTETKYLLLVVCISLLCFFLSGFVFNGSLSTKRDTASELISPTDSMYHYNTTKISPFKYRVLFPTLVQGTYNLLKGDSDNNELFYHTYITWMGIVYVGAAVAFYYLLLVVGFSPHFSFAGVIIYLLSPAVLFAFTIPVHTREDFLGYLLLCLGLISILKNRIYYVLLFSILGVLCRETLLILPFLYLFFQPAEKLSKRFIVAIISFCTFFIIRIVEGYERYEVLDLGLFYNFSEIAESVGFLFLVFSFMWIFFLIDNYLNYVKGHKIFDKKIQFFRDSSLPVFLLVFLSTLVAGRFNEIRLMNLLFPWMIITALLFFKQGMPVLKEMFTNKLFRIFAIALLLLFVIGGAYIIQKTAILFPPGQYVVPFEQWVAITVVYLYISIVTLVLASRFFIDPSFKSNKILR